MTRLAVMAAVSCLMSLGVFSRAPLAAQRVATRIEVRSSDQTLEYQITGYAIAEVNASGGHTLTTDANPPLYIRLAVAPIVTGSELSGVALAIVATRATSPGVQDVASFSNEIVPLSELEARVRAGVKALLK